MREIQGRFKLDGYEKPFSYPTQAELSKGWELVKPKKLFIKKFNKETKKTKLERRIFYNEVTLDKLPPKIWKRINPYSVYNCAFNDDFYKFKVKPTKDDDDIITLYRMIHKKILNKEKIKELYESLKKKGFNGWVLIKAKRCLE